TNGEVGTVARISDADPEMLRYFGAVGITLDTQLTVLERRDFAGTVSIGIGAPPQRTVDLGSPAAQSIWVVA
ncbi:MAG: FeoA family protein, partial [Mycobacterium sp.]